MLVKSKAFLWQKLTLATFSFHLLYLKIPEY